MNTEHLYVYRRLDEWFGDVLERKFTDNIAHEFNQRIIQRLRGTDAYEHFYPISRDGKINESKKMFSLFFESELPHYDINKRIIQKANHFLYVLSTHNADSFPEDIPLSDITSILFQAFEQLEEVVDFHVLVEREFLFESSTIGQIRSIFQDSPFYRIQGKLCDAIIAEYPFVYQNLYASP